MAKQLAEPRPDDLDRVDLRFYRQLDPRWQDWSAVSAACKRTAAQIIERMAEDATEAER